MSEHSIHDAAGKGDLATVRKFLESDAHLANQDDKYQWRPIFHAALNKHIDVVSLLIDFGADLSAHDGYVMHYAGEVPDNKPIVELLIKYGALDAHTHPNNELARQFIHAVFLANESRVRNLLQSNRSLATERYARGDTALHHACRNGDTTIVTSLLGNGADVNAITDHGHFPLYCAAGHGHAEVTTCLLTHHANRYQTMPDGKTVAEWLSRYADKDRRLKTCLELIVGK